MFTDDKGNFEGRKCVIIDGLVIPERRDFEDAPQMIQIYEIGRL